MAYADQFNNSGAPAFVGRVTIAAITYIATVVYTEGSAAANHANRASFARQFLLSPASYNQQMAYVAAQQLTYDNPAAAPADAQVLTTVGNCWNAFAGGF